LAFGFTIMVLAHGIAHISGGHINPAVTLALVITRRVELLRGLAYMAAQVCPFAHHFVLLCRQQNGHGTGPVSPSYVYVVEEDDSRMGGQWRKDPTRGSRRN
jgi:hypothetical protein